MELLDSLAMSGIANEIAGSSAPTSGSEHLISHALDGEQEQTRKMLPEITAWSRAERLKVLNPGLGRSEEADCIAVYGLKEMASSPRLLGGTYGLPSDQDGCVISRGLAMELFGGLDVRENISGAGRSPTGYGESRMNHPHVILLPAQRERRHEIHDVYIRKGGRKWCGRRDIPWDGNRKISGGKFSLQEWD